MSILLDQNTRVLIQGITGRSGRKATEEMLAEGTKIVCGVTPGKGGQKINAIPVFDTVEEAMRHDNKINTSVILVPPLLVLDATHEAIRAGIKLINIITENVPIQDSMKIVAYAEKHNVRVIGPSSVGIIVPGTGKLGMIASAKEKDMYTPGNVGVISKSGGMCAETSRLLTQEGLGQSTVVGIGGDVIIGSTFADIMELFEQDSETEAAVLFGEIGGAYEELAAEMVEKKLFTKPLIAFIGGRFAEQTTKGLALGHAGAIVETGFGTAEQKKRVLKAAGAIVADYHDDIPRLVKEALVKK